MPKNPLVSVIIPAYKAEPYITDAIESVLAQTYQPIEILVAYRDSSDGTKAILDRYATAKKITIVHQEGKGLSNGRNGAIKHARGEFVALLDADDLFLPTKIEAQVGYLTAHPECDACYVDIRHFKDHNLTALLELQYTYYSGDAVLPNLLKKNFIAPSTVMLRRTIMDRAGLFDEALTRSEDWEYWLRLIRNSAMICFLSQTLGRIRLHSDSMSSGWRSKLEERKTNIHILKNLRAQLPFEHCRPADIDRAIFRQQMQLWYIYLGIYFPPLQWLHQRIQNNRFT
jgi:glycosyltransferase involved in cell wall biosynthesis